ncbi:hypothetical protein KAZ92_00865 [Candidatus Gracilibacteria bacterium]|nr:hypothetical protein [Candidatus Gracilibacteria bacterium]
MASFATSSVAIEFPKEVVKMLMGAIDDGTKQAARMLWSTLISFLSEHWLLTILIFFLILVFATLKAMIWRWGTLGSVLYNSMYFGILLVVGLIWGPDIFTSDIFHAACAVILYPICYFLTGTVLDKIGVRRI